MLLGNIVTKVAEIVAVLRGTIFKGMLSYEKKRKYRTLNIIPKESRKCLKEVIVSL